MDAGDSGSTTDAGVPIDELGTPCADGGCPSGLQPITYCGIAGCTNGQLCSCEISCAQTASVCPPGSTCATVSDGPGTVCVKK